MDCQKLLVHSLLAVVAIVALSFGPSEVVSAACTTVTKATNEVDPEEVAHPGESDCCEMSCAFGDPPVTKCCPKARFFKIRMGNRCVPALELEQTCCFEFSAKQVKYSYSCEEVEGVATCKPAAAQESTWDYTGFIDVPCSSGYAGKCDLAQPVPLTLSDLQQINTDKGAGENIFPDPTVLATINCDEGCPPCE